MHRVQKIFELLKAQGANTKTERPSNRNYLTEGMGKEKKGGKGKGDFKWLAKDWGSQEQKKKSWRQGKKKNRGGGNLSISA